MTSLAEKPKVYSVVAIYKSAWPSVEPFGWRYTSFPEAQKHIIWLCGQVALQNGKGVLRKNVIVRFQLGEQFASKRRDKRYPPLETFQQPKDHEKPAKGLSLGHHYFDHDAL